MNVNRYAVLKKSVYEIFHQIGMTPYSLLKLFTGFATAALNAL